MPGLGHWYAGHAKKCVALFCIDAAIILSLIFSKSALILLLTGVIYLSTLLPAMLEAYQLALGVKAAFTHSRIYVVFMLLVTGITALPLLWQSGLFSGRAKKAWSVAVIVLAILYFTALAVWGRRLDKWLGEH